ncbi:sigma-54-dependent Fis family transcriptional regulator [Fusobacterium sp. FSA-380-WT-3A]|nr:sigma-54-dependent Fis family transcriptional regulator [Fusobacterium sp. FSA-380-WT-3A]
MIFSQKEEGKYLILLKQKDFFKTILNENDSYTNEKKYTFENVIGKSPQILKVIDECKKIADGNSNILITGESGTGKEFFARAIHNNSSRRNFPFIPVNCGSIPRELIESELFGYESGAFTGANKQGYIGKFQLANGGTIFLDEIGEMPLNMQVSLLRVLQDKCVTKIGSKKCTKVDVRVIAATNKCLKDEIKKERFRKDLYYRLNAFNINIPPLKERIGDIPIFLEHLLKEKSIELNKPIPKVPKPLFQKIISYCWPGNIRELQNFVENFVVLDGISTYDINFDECHCMTHDNLGNRIEINQCGVIEKVEDKILPLVELEKREIEKAIKIYDGNMTHIASALGISRNALYNKMKRYGIEK